MNTDVRQIVDLLFDDIEENEEVRAIHEEVLNNCQERYENLIRSGSDEQEAVKAVVESLMGMEELLGKYPKKSGRAVIPAEQPLYDDIDLPWGSVSTIQIDVRSADVEVRETEGRPSLTLEHGSGSILKARVEGNTLHVTQEDVQEHRIPREEKPTGLLDALTKVIEAFRSGTGEGGRVEIGVPAGLIKSARVNTASGDIEIGIRMDEIVLRTASGDCDVDIGSAFSAPCSLQAASASGDMDVSGAYADAVLGTTSGDIGFDGAAGDLKLKSVSGDIHAEAEARSISAHAVSGDIEISVDGAKEAELDLKTVSGDISLEVADGGEGIAADIHTRSGDVNCSDIGIRDDAPVRARIETVSGDVDISAV
ncbi:MAG: DUF4097 family beta strand repeat protein [Clostridia bacterium]|nr:DUF4097 family beta strand repeat protein [Clostridia bacterium]